MLTAIEKGTDRIFFHLLTLDLRRSLRECEFEVSYSLEIIEKQYTSLNFEESLQKERNLARGNTTADWREPVGTVGILYQSNSILLFELSLSFRIP
jgi:acyl-CoA reductase-like NAD-dependent aldehyde dehydrogenase